MSGALRFEWVRLRTLRSTWWLALASVAATASMAWGAASALPAGPFGEHQAVTLLTAGAPSLVLVPAGVLMAVVGVFALGHEFRFGTLRATLLAVPGRWRLLLAKAAVVGLFAAVVAVCCSAVSWAVGYTIHGEQLLRLPWDSQTVARAVGGYVGFVTLCALFGLALAGVCRGVAVAMAAILAVPLLLEPAVVQLLRQPDLEPLRAAGSFLPFAAGERMFALTGRTLPDWGPALTPLIGGATMAGYVLVLLVAAAVSLRARDVG